MGTETLTKAQQSLKNYEDAAAKVADLEKQYQGVLTGLETVKRNASAGEIDAGRLVTLRAEEELLSEALDMAKRQADALKRLIRPEVADVAEIVAKALDGKVFGLKATASTERPASNDYEAHVHVVQTSPSKGIGLGYISAGLTVYVTGPDWMKTPERYDTFEQAFPAGGDVINPNRAASMGDVFRRNGNAYVLNLSADVFPEVPVCAANPHSDVLNRAGAGEVIETSVDDDGIRTIKARRTVQQLARITNAGDLEKRLRESIGKPTEIGRIVSVDGFSKPQEGYSKAGAEIVTMSATVTYVAKVAG